MDLAAEFGAIDIYLFDQLLRQRITPADRVFDAGCGGGRNLVYLLRAGFDVGGVDPDAAAIDAMRRLAAELAPALPADRFRVEPVERTSFPDAWATVVLSSAVLHFAADAAHFDAMLGGAWRVLAPGGLFFCRLASTIGIEAHLAPGAAGRRARLPDGSDRFLVDESDAPRTHGGARRPPARSAEDDGGAEPAGDDDVGGAQGWMNRSSSPTACAPAAPPSRRGPTRSCSSRRWSSPAAPSTMPAARALAVGEVVSIEPDGEQEHRVVLAQPAGDRGR